MDHALNPIHGPLHILDPDEFGRHKFLIRAQISRYFDVAQPQLRIDRFKDLAQPRADVARSAREQNACHLEPPFNVSYSIAGCGYPDTGSVLQGTLGKPSVALQAKLRVRCVRMAPRSSADCPPRTAAWS